MHRLSVRLKLTHSYRRNSTGVALAAVEMSKLRMFNKSLLADTASCLRLGWLNRRAERTKLSTFERFLATQGERFEEYAVNRLFVESNDNEDNGDPTTRTVTIESRDASEGHRQTLELLQDPHVMTVLQPTFYHPPFTARGDVLHREGAGERTRVMSLHESP